MTFVMTKSNELFATLFERYPLASALGGSGVKTKLYPAPPIVPAYLINGNCPRPNVRPPAATLPLLASPPVTRFDATIFVTPGPANNCNDAFVSATVKIGSAGVPAVLVI